LQTISKTSLVDLLSILKANSTEYDFCKWINTH